MTLSEKNGGMSREQFDTYNSMIDNMLEYMDSLPEKGSFGWRCLRGKIEEERMNLYHHTLGWGGAKCDIDAVEQRYGKVVCVIDWKADVTKKMSKTAQRGYTALNVPVYIASHNPSLSRFHVRELGDDKVESMDEKQFRKFMENL